MHLLSATVLYACYLCVTSVTVPKVVTPNNTKIKQNKTNNKTKQQKLKVYRCEPVHVAAGLAVCSYVYHTTLALYRSTPVASTVCFAPHMSMRMGHG
jgi:hypothetical protein